MKANPCKTIFQWGGTAVGFLVDAFRFYLTGSIGAKPATLTGNEGGTWLGNAICPQNSDSGTPSTNGTGETIATYQTPIRGSIDQISSTGYGTEGWVKADQTLPYQINFENLETATAAHSVGIESKLDANLDWNTFRLTQFSFGNTIVILQQNASPFQYEQTVQMKAANGKLAIEKCSVRHTKNAARV